MNVFVGSGLKRSSTRRSPSCQKNVSPRKSRPAKKVLKAALPHHVLTDSSVQGVVRVRSDLVGSLRHSNQTVQEVVAQVEAAVASEVSVG